MHGPINKYLNQINHSSVSSYSFFLLLHIFIYSLPKNKMGIVNTRYKCQRDVGHGGKQKSVVDKNADSGVKVCESSPI